MICYYLLLNHGFKFEDSVCNGCHDLTMSSVNIIDTTIITIKSVDYRCIIHNINQSEAINLFKHSGLENRGYIKKYCLKFQPAQGSLFLYFFLFYYI